MGYFTELPNILYQSPYPTKKSTGDYIAITNIFRRAKIFESLQNNIFLFDKYVIGDNERPDNVAENMYGDATLDYIVIISAGITNINHQWPLQDYQVYDNSLARYGSEIAMNEIHHYETYEIKDSQGRQILPPDLIVDEKFKIDGSSLRFGTNRFTIISQLGNRQLDDKNEYTVAADKIARPVTNYEHDIFENDKLRKIDILRPSLVPTFIEDFKDAVRYEKSSSFIRSDLARTENTNIIP